MKLMDVIVAVVLVVGGLNWGLIGFFQFDLVASLFGGTDALAARVVYAVVGVAAVYQVVSLKAIQSRWGVQTAMTA